MTDPTIISIQIQKNKKRFVPSAARGRPRPKRKRSDDEDPPQRPIKVAATEPGIAEAVEQYVNPNENAINDHAGREMAETMPAAKSTISTVSASTELRPLQDASNASSEETQPTLRNSKVMDPAEVERIAREYLCELQKKRPKRHISSGVSKSALLKRAEEELAEKARKHAEEEEEEKKKQQEKQRNPIVPQVKIVNGEIVLDEDSLFVESGAIVCGEEDPREVVDITEETDVKETQQLLGRARSWTRPWSVEETELFYDLLSVHGPAFHRMSNYIPGRTAKHIQKKYKKECKENPIRIQDCMERA